MKRIVFTITNDISYDQRMHRICTSLAGNGYHVTLIGCLRKQSIPLQKENYQQKRLSLFFQKGFLFYAEYNIRLFFYLLFKKADLLCAIDLDTILPCLYISRLKKIARVYDAHELFTEQNEIVRRPSVQKIWLWIEKKAVPQFQHGYTVCTSIADFLKEKYSVDYKVIRNVTLLNKQTLLDQARSNILYQGAVNEARGFEFLIPAMKWVDEKLIICGDGNFMNAVKQLIKENGVEEKVELKGMMKKEELWNLSLKAKIGITIIENTGLNQYFSLPNKFFDYIHAAIPQIAMNYPEYQTINNQYEVAVLLDNYNPKNIADTINNLLSDSVLYNRLRENCMQARLQLNWQNEEMKLLNFYQSVLES